MKDLLTATIPERSNSYTQGWNDATAQLRRNQQFEQRCWELFCKTYNPELFLAAKSDVFVQCIINSVKEFERKMEEVKE
jgi:hypothetical protein